MVGTAKRQLGVMTATMSSVESHLRFLMKDSVVYGIGSALNRVITVIMFPLLARHFTVEEFGRLDLLNTGLLLVVTALVLGQDSAVARFIHEYDERVEQRQVVSQSLLLQLVLLALTVVPICLFADMIARRLNIKIADPGFIRLLAMQLPFLVLINFAQGLLKWTFRRNSFLIVSVGSTALTLLGILLLIRLNRLSVNGIFGVYLAVRALFGLAGLWYVRDWLELPTGLNHLKALVPYAVPFGIICVLASLVPVIERSAVNNLVGPQALGVFAAGSKVALFISLATTAFDTAWGPFSMSKLRDNNAERTFRVVLTTSTIVLCIAVLVLSAAGELIVTLLGSSRYAGAGAVVFAMSMGVVVQFLGGLTQIGITFAKRSYLKLYAYSLGILIGWGAIYLLGTRFAAVGVAWGSLIGQSAKTVFETWLAQRAHRIHWHFRVPTTACILTIFVGILSQVTFDRAVWNGLRWVPLIGSLPLLWLGWSFIRTEFANPTAIEIAS